jgi:hypothetical protein
MQDINWMDSYEDIKKQRDELQLAVSDLKTTVGRLNEELQVVHLIFPCV